MTRMFSDLTPYAGETGTPVSQKIRARLREANQRFHANDNIAAYIESGELDALQAVRRHDPPRPPAPGPRRAGRVKAAAA